MSENKILPRTVPDKDSRYMGEAWCKAAFSKDPNTQVGAVIIGINNTVVASGYNGPPRLIDDNSFSWERPPKDDPDAFSKYDVIVHAEINAIDHASASVAGSTLYVTAMPCPDCMLEIIRKEISRVVYYEYQSSPNSMLQNTQWKEKTMKLASMGRVRLEEFKGNLNWLSDWHRHLKDIGIFA